VYGLVLDGVGRRGRRRGAGASRLRGRAVAALAPSKSGGVEAAWLGGSGVGAVTSGGVKAAWSDGSGVGAVDERGRRGCVVGDSGVGAVEGGVVENCDASQFDRFESVSRQSSALRRSGGSRPADAA
jgi:hypothetical protein